MNNWLTPALVTIIFWGLWGFIPKLATNYTDPKSALVWQVVGSIIAGLVILLLAHFKVNTHPKGILFGTLAGLAGMFGALAFLVAMSKGKAAVVVTITALYPLVTIFLSFLLLKETLTPKQGVGIILALMAMLFFA